MQISEKCIQSTLLLLLLKQIKKFMIVLKIKCIYNIYIILYTHILYELAKKGYIWTVWE